MPNQKVFLAGATGVIGHRAARQLIAAGHSVTALARTDAKAEHLRSAGATAINADIFSPKAMAASVVGHDAVINLATNIPTGAAAGRKAGWATNDRLRRDASAILAAAAIDTGVGQFVQESITFPYLDRSDAWIDETGERDFFWGNATVQDAEASAQAVTDAGGSGVVLRFSMFVADDSAHVRSMVQGADKGLSPFTGEEDSFISFIDVDDAAAAVVAALGAPAGVYNVSEADPTTRRGHADALASALGRRRLKPLPKLAQRALGKGIESISRSHRISSQGFQEVTDWRPTREPAEQWADIVKGSR